MPNSYKNLMQRFKKLRTDVWEPHHKTLDRCANPSFKASKTTIFNENIAYTRNYQYIRVSGTRQYIRTNSQGMITNSRGIVLDDCLMELIESKDLYYLHGPLYGYGDFLVLFNDKQDFAIRCRHLEPIPQLFADGWKIRQNTGLDLILYDKNDKIKCHFGRDIKLYYKHDQNGWITTFVAGKLPEAIDYCRKITKGNLEIEKYKFNINNDFSYIFKKKHNAYYQTQEFNTAYVLGPCTIKDGQVITNQNENANAILIKANSSYDPEIVFYNNGFYKVKDQAISLRTDLYMTQNDYEFLKYVIVNSI